jgi:3-oxoacyl-[acyl-carrier protein] reductase
MNALIFGGSGEIGSKICDVFQESFNLFKASRFERDGFLKYDPSSNSSYHFPKLDAICFAQGLNINDSILNFDTNKHLEVYQANCLFIMQAMSDLLKQKAIKKNAKIVVISSIWQEIARKNKLSYSVTKSALKGLISSLALDLGEQGILVNAILPGAIDNKMTRSNLSTAQLENLVGMTPTKNLSKEEEIARLALFLCSSQNQNLTNQFITLDGGFSFAKNI